MMCARLLLWSDDAGRDRVLKAYKKPLKPVPDRGADNAPACTTPLARQRRPYAWRESIGPGKSQPGAQTHIAPLT